MTTSTAESRPRLRVAIIGAGYVAKHHLAALSRLKFVDLVGIADIDLNAAQTLARDWGIACAARSLAELSVHHPNVVFVLTPPASHCDIVMAALDLNCHVLVEKPMADSVAECDRMIAGARDKGLVLSVNHSDRFDPAVLQALKLVRDGKCGELMAVDFLRSSEYPAYSGGPLPAMVGKGSYPFRDIGVHGLYLLEAFLGPIQALSINRRASGRNPNLKFDEWHATAECAQGLGRLQLSWNVRPMQNKLLIQGTQAVIEVDRFLQICRVSRDLPGPKFIGIVIASLLNALKDIFRIPWNVMRFATGRLKSSPGIQRGAEEFVRALHAGRRPPVSAEEGRHVVALMEAACADADAERAEELAQRFGELRPARILVTGAAGFLGRALVKKLRADGESVRVLVRRAPIWLRDDPGVEIVVGDLGEPAIVAHAVSGVSAVYHLGATMKGTPGDFAAGTVWGTRNIVDACLNNNVQRLIYVSSLSVLDHAGRDPDAYLNEHAKLEPHPDRRGAYTQTKLTAEKIVVDAIRHQGLDAVLIRPGQIFGPGAERSVPNATVSIAGRWVAVGPGRQTLPLVYIDDVVEALQLAERLPKSATRLFNIVDSASITHADYMAYCRHLLGKELKLVRVPTPIFMALAFGVEVLGKLLRRNVPLTRYRVQSLRPLANFDLTAADTQLGWKPKIGAREGLRRTFGGTKNYARGTPRPSRING
jgi:2-alkyl-3-oxoalkanoate reductase